MKTKIKRMFSRAVFMAGVYLVDGFYILVLKVTNRRWTW